MKRRCIHFLALSTVTSIFLVSCAATAQLSSSPDAIVLPPGATFEIQAVDTTSSNWVLTQEREFIAASREQVFRHRFVHEGVYELHVDASFEETQIQHSFTITVRRDAHALADEKHEGNVFSIDPSPHEDVLDMSSISYLRIESKRTDTTMLAIDLNTEQDGNGDGNTQNDNDTAGTFFGTGGNPLYLWFPEPSHRTMRLGALFSDNSTDFTTLHLRFTETSPSSTGSEEESNMPSMESETLQILLHENNNGRVSFGIGGALAEDHTVLFHWDFGDGRQSLLNSPVHSYATSGTYKVRVSARDVRTGNILESTEDTIVVNMLSTTDDNDIPSSPEKHETTVPINIPNIFWNLLKYLMIFILAGALGAGVLFIINKLRSRGFSLEKTIEKAEQTIVKTPEEQTTSDAPPPMEISYTEEVVQDAPQEASTYTQEQSEDSTTTPTPSSPEESSPSLNVQSPVEEPAPNVAHDAMQPSTEELHTDTSQAPSWLQQGIQQAEETGQTPDAPPPPSLQNGTPSEPMTPVIEDSVPSVTQDTSLPKHPSEYAQVPISPETSTPHETPQPEPSSNSQSQSANAIEEPSAVSENHQSSLQPPQTSQEAQQTAPLPDWLSSPHTTPSPQDHSITETDVPEHDASFSSKHPMEETDVPDQEHTMNDEIPIDEEISNAQEYTDDGTQYPAQTQQAHTSELQQSDEEYQKRERDRKRRKRQRYRENLKKRKQMQNSSTSLEEASDTSDAPTEQPPPPDPLHSSKASSTLQPPASSSDLPASSEKHDSLDEPIAFIRADSVEQQELPPKSQQEEQNEVSPEQSQGHFQE